MKLKFPVIALGSLLALAACDQKSDSAKDEAPVNAPAPEGAKPQGAVQPGTGQPAGEPAAGQPAAGQPAAGQPAAAQPSPWAGRDKLQLEMQAKLDGLATKVEALKQKSETKEHKANKKLKEHLAALHTKLDGARTDVKALAASTEATFTEVKTKAEKSVQELEMSLEQAAPKGMN